MVQSRTDLEADRISYAISVTQIVQLARCVSTENVLAYLSHLAVARGVVLCGAKLVRAGLSREWQVQEAPTVDTEVHELEARIEGGLTRLSLRLAGRMDAAVRCELEDAAYMAAQRIELPDVRGLKCLVNTASSRWSGPDANDPEYNPHLTLPPTTFLLFGTEHV